MSIRRRHARDDAPALHREGAPDTTGSDRGDRGDRADRGSGAIIAVFFAVVVLGLAAFIVDGGMAIAQRERAMDIAEQAARYAAQDLDEETLRAGGTVGINFDNCPARVAEFVGEVSLSSASVTGHDCTAYPPDEVGVEIVVTYRPVFAGVLFNTLTARGSATARADTGTPPTP